MADAVDRHWRTLFKSGRLGAAKHPAVPAYWGVPGDDPNNEKNLEDLKKSLAYLGPKSKAALFGGDKVSGRSVSDLVTGRDAAPDPLSGMVGGLLDAVPGAIESGRTLPSRMWEDYRRARQEGRMGEYASNVAHQATNAVMGGLSDKMGRALLRQTGVPEEQLAAGQQQNDERAAQFPATSGAIGVGGVAGGLLNPVMATTQLAGFGSDYVKPALDWTTNVLAKPENWMLPEPKPHQAQTQDAYLAEHLGAAPSLESIIASETKRLQDAGYRAVTANTRARQSAPLIYEAIKKEYEARRARMVTPESGDYAQHVAALAKQSSDERADYNKKDVFERVPLLKAAPAVAATAAAYATRKYLGGRAAKAGDLVTAFDNAVSAPADIVKANTQLAKAATLTGHPLRTFAMGAAPATLDPVLRASGDAYDALVLPHDAEASQRAKHRLRSVVGGGGTDYLDYLDTLPLSLAGTMIGAKVAAYGKNQPWGDLRTMQKTYGDGSEPGKLVSVLKKGRDAADENLIHELASQTAGSNAKKSNALVDLTRETGLMGAQSEALIARDAINRKTFDAIGQPWPTPAPPAKAGSGGSLPAVRVRKGRADPQAQLSERSQATGQPQPEKSPALPPSISTSEAASQKVRQDYYSTVADELTAGKSLQAADEIAYAKHRAGITPQLRAKMADDINRVRAGGGDLVEKLRNIVGSNVKLAVPAALGLGGLLSDPAPSQAQNRHSGSGRYLNAHGTNTAGDRR